MRILIVDDDYVNRKLPAVVLGRVGHVVIEAANGTDALAIAARETVDVVLLDLTMPDMSGYEVCRQLRARAGGDALRIVAYTAYGMDSVNEPLQASGFDALLLKPVTPADILAAIRPPSADAGDPPSPLG
ncbi:response regulator [Denitromonas iodatirespirans]|uniref:Response regulator n=1 Tax=Denitromonas iodatirespirans TaxID=2795389 RepID=A0A944D9F3_DENI1|nr:response regulator [Denitromonas iodatirespirans]MBT0960831.1 response regulator [Denitromonas iodatirespirans]